MAKDPNEFARSVLDQIIAKLDPEASREEGKRTLRRSSIKGRWNYQAHLDVERFTVGGNTYISLSVNYFRALCLLFLLLPSVAIADNLKSCREYRSHYRNLESQAITKVEAPYPSEHLRAKGTVVVLIKVNHHGDVVYARAICGHPLLMAASVNAARGWKFKPRRVKGRPANSLGVIRFEFLPT